MNHADPPREFYDGSGRRLRVGDVRFVWRGWGSAERIGRCEPGHQISRATVVELGTTEVRIKIDGLNAPRWLRPHWLQPDRDAAIAAHETEAMRP